MECPLADVVATTSNLQFCAANQSQSCPLNAPRALKSLSLDLKNTLQM